MQKLMCGAADRIITPSIEKNLDMPGYGYRRVPSKVLSDLQTNVIVLDNGEQRSVIISVDLCFIERSFVYEMKTRIADMLGIDQDDVTFAVTHNHTGSVACHNWIEEGEPEMNIVINSTIDAIKEAISNMKPVTVRFAEGENREVSFNRVFKMKNGRYQSNPRGESIDNIVCPSREIDYSLNLIHFDDEEGNPIAHILNFALHCDTVGSDNYCADYPGELRKYAKERFGNKFVSLFLTGCCGNVNHVDVSELKAGIIHEEPPYIRIGRKLWATVNELYNNLETDENPIFKTACTHFHQKRRQPTAENIEWSNKIIENPKGVSPYNLDGARLIRRMVNNPKYYSRVDIQAIRIGDCAITTLPCEAWSSISLDIKKSSPFKHVLISEQTNGWLGYVSVEPEFSGGIYEARIAPENACLPPEAADNMISTTLELLNKLK